MRHHFEHALEFASGPGDLLLEHLVRPVVRSNTSIRGNGRSSSGPYLNMEAKAPI